MRESFLDLSRGLKEEDAKEKNGLHHQKQGVRVVTAKLAAVTCRFLGICRKRNILDTREQTAPQRDKWQDHANKLKVEKNRNGVCWTASRSLLAPRTTAVIPGTELPTCTTRESYATISGLPQQPPATELGLLVGNGAPKIQEP